MNPRATKHDFGGQNEAKIVNNHGPGAFQQQTGSEEGPEAKKDPKLSEKKNSVWDPFQVFFWTDFWGFSGTPFFPFFDKTDPQNGTNTGSLFETLDLAQV